MRQEPPIINIGKALHLPEVKDLKTLNKGDKLHLFSNHTIDFCYTVVGIFSDKDYVEIRQDGITATDRLHPDMFNEYKVTRFSREGHPEYFL